MEKAALLKVLQKLLGAETELDMKGLRKMFETFLDLTDPNKMNDRDREPFTSVATGKTKIKDLPLNDVGRRIWYESLREDDDEEWKEGGTEPDKDKQYFLTKLRTVARLGLQHLVVMEKRWEKGLNMGVLYDSFMIVANTTGPGQTVLNLQLKKVKRENVIKSIDQGSKDADEWATQISEYFGVSRTGEFQSAMKFFFPGAGFDLEDKIDWKKLKDSYKTKTLEHSSKSVMRLSQLMR